MSETNRIAEQLKRSLEGEAWHGPALFELLEGVSAEQAATRPIGKAHSIWELVAHLAVWSEEARARYLGGGRNRLTSEEDFPPTPEPADETAWNAVRERLRAAHEAWYAELEKIDAAQLYPPQQEKYPSLYVILHGLAHHNLYHAGQVALIRKAW